MKEIQLQLTVDEINLILEGLGNMPFKQVFQLIGRIQEQAGKQLEASNGRELGSREMTVSGTESEKS